MQNDDEQQFKYGNFYPLARPHQPSRISRLIVVSPWLSSSILLVFLLIAIKRSPSQEECAKISFWRDLEFGTAKKDIPPIYHTYQFQGGLVYNEAHELYVQHSDPTYVGPPSAEIDRAWKDIVSPVNVLVTKEESAFFPHDELFVDVETGLYTAMITMTHDLHCLNMLRKAIYLDYYPELQSSTLRRHLDHCIDGLRESIMCTGDMTLIPIVWSASRNWIMPNFKTYHTCRNFDSLKAWARARDSEAPRYVETSERYRKTGSFLTST